MTPQGPAPPSGFSQFQVNVGVSDQQTSSGSSSGHQHQTGPPPHNVATLASVEAGQNVVFPGYDAGVEGDTSPYLDEDPQEEIIMNDIVGVAYELPGADWYPGHVSSRDDDEGSWMKGRFEAVIVGGQRFTVPLELLKHIPKWRPLSTGKAPAQGLLMPHEDPKIFAVLLECVYSPSGFNGTETHLNMVKLVMAMVMASRWGMFDEITKLDHSLRRYIARRVLYRQPFKPDFAGILDWNYFKYRSEEIYRTWDLCQKNECLQMTMSVPRLVALYATAIPHELWPALTPDMESGFTQLIDAFAAGRGQVPDAGSFVQWWFKFFKEADCVDYPWFGHDGAKYMFDRHQGFDGEHLDEDLDENSQSDLDAASILSNIGEAAYAEAAAQTHQYVYQPAHHYHHDADPLDEDFEYVQQISQNVEPDALLSVQRRTQADDAAPTQDDAPVDVLDSDDERARQRWMAAVAEGDARLALYLKRLEERDARKAAAQEAKARGTDQHVQRAEEPAQQPVQPIYSYAAPERPTAAIDIPGTGPLTEQDFWEGYSDNEGSFGSDCSEDSFSPDQGDGTPDQDDPDEIAGRPMVFEMSGTDLIS